jgi:hypothetical protein
MKRYLAGFGILGFLMITTIGFTIREPQPAGTALAPKSLSSSEPVMFTLQPKDTVPEVITSPSCIGEVLFPHSLHFEGMEFECTECHHETNAAELTFFHKEYFEEFWIDCTICHRESGETMLGAQACANCHHTHPASITDETLSAKVVIHQNCWQCHEVGTGQQASQYCAFCHGGPKMECW